MALTAPSLPIKMVLRLHMCFVALLWHYGACLQMPSFKSCPHLTHACDQYGQVLHAQSQHADHAPSEEATVETRWNLVLQNMDNPSSERSLGCCTNSAPAHRRQYFHVHIQNILRLCPAGGP